MVLTASQLAYAVDLERGLAPLTFERDANPDGLEPKLLTDGGGAFLRLEVQRGAYPAATRGEPHLCDRCELRDPEKLPMSLPAWHGFSIRIPPAFPSTGQRFVAAQMKANGGASPLLAIRISQGRFFADWRIGGTTIEHHDSLPGGSGDWVDVALHFAADVAELWVAGRLISRARADFVAIAATRYLKLGPYRDKHPAWGDAPAAIDIRNIRRGASRADVEVPHAHHHPRPARARGAPGGGPYRLGDRRPGRRGAAAIRHRHGPAAAALPGPCPGRERLADPGRREPQLFGRPLA